MPAFCDALWHCWVVGRFCAGSLILLLVVDTGFGFIGGCAHKCLGVNAFVGLSVLGFKLWIWYCYFDCCGVVIVVVSGCFCCCGGVRVRTRVGLLGGCGGCVVCGLGVRVYV